MLSVAIALMFALSVVMLIVVMLSVVLDVTEPILKALRNPNTVFIVYSTLQQCLSQLSL